MSINMYSRFLQRHLGYHAVDAIETFVSFSLSVLKAFSIFNGSYVHDQCLAAFQFCVG